MSVVNELQSKQAKQRDGNECIVKSNNEARNSLRVLLKPSSIHFYTTLYVIAG
jgi:hypothetical protein